VHTGLAWVATLAFVFAGSVLDERGSRTVLLVIAAVLAAVGVAAVVPTVRRAVRNRELMSRLRAWETAERQARSLPPGQVRPDLRTPFDARRDADFDLVANKADSAAYGKVTRGRLMWRVVPTALGLPLGAVLLTGPFADPQMSVMWGVAGGYLVVCSVVSIAATMRLSWCAWMFWRSQSADITEWRSERIGPMAAAEVDRAWLRKRWQIAAPFIAISLLGLAARVSTSSPQALGILVGIVGLGGFVTCVVLLFRRLRQQSTPPVERDRTSVPPG
jgi:hypothetical protein